MTYDEGLLKTPIGKALFELKRFSMFFMRMSISLNECGKIKIANFGAGLS